MSARTAPTSGTALATGRLRKRSKTPFSTSVLRFTPMDTPAIAMVWARRPGSRNWR